MRIAVVTTSPLGGLLHYATQMADGLATRGHAADVIAPRGNELVGRTVGARMRDVLVAPVGSAEVPRSRALYLARRVWIALRLVAAWLRIIREARFGGYDAVIITADISLEPPAAALLALTALPGGPLITIVGHNVRIFNRWGGDELYHEPRHLLWLFRQIYRRADIVFVHGERSRKEFEETWPQAHLAVIPHGDERLFAGEPPPPSDQERILFFGDWRKVKGLDTLMTAFDALLERRPGVRLTIAGTPAPGDFDPEIVLAWAAGHGDKVEVIDRYVALDDVPAIFGAARLVVTPYHTGSQSGVVHLAMTMARAVVTTDVGDLGTIVAHEQTGIVVGAGDVPALVDALERVVSDPELAARMGAAAHARLAESASWEQVAAQLEAALLECDRTRA